MSGKSLQDVLDDLKGRHGDIFQEVATNRPKSLQDLLGDLIVEHGPKSFVTVEHLDTTSAVMEPLVRRLIAIVNESKNPRKDLYKMGIRLFEYLHAKLIGLDALAALFEAGVNAGLSSSEVESCLNGSRKAAEQKWINAGTQRETEGGYWEVHEPKHALASSGWVARHRFVLYNSLSSACNQPCATCGWSLPWRSGWSKSCINVDHVNGIKGDDRLENLRVLCYWCNVHRNRAEVESPVEWAKAIQDYKHVAPWDRPTFTGQFLPDIKGELALGIVCDISNELVCHGTVLSDSLFERLVTMTRENL